MIRTTAAFFLVLALHVASAAQSLPTDTLEVKEGFFSEDYYRGGKEISKDEFLRSLKSSPDPSIYQLYSSGESTKSAANILGFGGGFCVGYGLSSKPTNTALTIVGAVTILGGIIIEGTAKSKMDQAIARYNSIESARRADLSFLYRDRTVFNISFSIPL